MQKRAQASHLRRRELRQVFYAQESSGKSLTQERDHANHLRSRELRQVIYAVEILFKPFKQ